MQSGTVDIVRDTTTVGVDKSPPVNAMFANCAGSRVSPQSGVNKFAVLKLSYSVGALFMSSVIAHARLSLIVKVVF